MERPNVHIKVSIEVVEKTGFPEKILAISTRDIAGNFDLDDVKKRVQRMSDVVTIETLELLQIECNKETSKDGE